ncbi:hypothetical protein L3V82_05350 [Thiotrichales bacterium 19S3-7]|nr:hypothetical protein [Thiotrichales bacterium 19S3-7]MCF6801519.1 hypothetical protein [Thiotrichales bacterium 19S3-11]
MDKMIITIVSLIFGMIGLLLGILGLIATLIGVWFSYISFVNPIKRFKKYVKNSNDWERFHRIENLIDCFRHKKYPTFQLIIDYDLVIVKDFSEDWIGACPDKGSNASYHVQYKVNDMLFKTELFVLLDGGRNFVPVPRVEVNQDQPNSRQFYYDIEQIQIANIVGKYHFEDNIYDYAMNHKIECRV